MGEQERTWEEIHKAESWLSPGFLKTLHEITERERRSTSTSCYPQKRIDLSRAMFQLEILNLEFSLTEGSRIGSILKKNNLQYNNR